MSKKEQNNEQVEAISIKPANIKDAFVWIKGNAPLVIHKFSHKAKMQIMQKQSEGTTANSKKKREAKDFDALFNEARHISFEGWDGIPASAFRCACIDACRLVGFKMTLAKMSIFFTADGFDRDEGTALIKIIGPEPRRLDSMVRIGSGLAKTVDVAVRAQWLEWGAKLRFRYDADQFTASDVVNLISRAGMQCGVCEGRPNSSASNGMGWGTFEVSTEEEVMALAKEGNK